jgi:hypothetical protein
MRLFLIFTMTLFSQIHSSLAEKEILYLNLNLQDGKELILSDNSHWIIHPEDQAISRMWIAPFPLEVTAIRSIEYPYLLTNLNSGKKIKAKRASN